MYCYTSLNGSRLISRILNVEKTSTVRVTSNKFSHYPLNLVYAAQALNEFNTITFLVCIFDNHLMWKLHIAFLLCKFGTACFFIRLTHVLGTDAIKNAHYSYFHSLIFWGNSTHITEVFLLQKWMIRIMMGVSLRCSCRGLLKKTSYSTCTMCICIFIDDVYC